MPEHMPADLGGGFEGDAVGEDALHPNTRIWREFRFGRRAAPGFTDYRSSPPDHLVPEAQAAWLPQALDRHADADWRLVDSSVSFTPLRLERLGKAARIPPA